MLQPARRPSPRPEIATSVVDVSYPTRIIYTILGSSNKVVRDGVLYCLIFPWETSSFAQHFTSLQLYRIAYLSYMVHAVQIEIRVLPDEL